eukprot:scaffold334000_cov34-Prasinocladus_malaysianus.AAC.1
MLGWVQDIACVSIPVAASGTVVPCGNTRPPLFPATPLEPPVEPPPVPMRLMRALSDDPPALAASPTLLRKAP